MTCVLLILSFLTVTCFLPQSNAQQRIALKLCSPKGNDDVCQQLARKNEIACKMNLHSVDCLKNIETNESHLGRISEEVAFLGANLSSDNILVIGEVIKEFSPSIPIVLVRKSLVTSNKDLTKNDELLKKKYCHPGFKHNHDVSTYLLKEFESSLIDSKSSDFCSSTNVTLIEKQIRALSKYFGDSCRPGPWTSNVTLNSYLEKKYSNLCKLCGEMGCTIDYKIPFRESLECLKNGGDVAVSSLHESETFFDQENKNNFEYLCRNGSTSPTPCLWTKPLSDLIVASKAKLDESVKILKEYLNEKRNGTSALYDSHNTASNSFNKILELESKTKVKVFTETQYKSLKEYVNERREVPTLEEAELCNQKVTWCTRSKEETEKCQWYSQAAINRALQPVVDCKQTANKEERSCLDDISNEEADLVTISADYAFITLKKGLSSVAYLETDTRTLPTILIAISGDNNEIKSIDDLKNKKACLPQYGGKEYLAFIENLRNLDKIEMSCNYEQIFSEYVSASCLPGAGSLISEQEEESINHDNKLCKLCKANDGINCNDDLENIYYNNTGSLRCLRDKIADFVVITQPLLSKSNKESYDDLQVICKNGSLAKYKGLYVDDECALTVIVSGEIVVNSQSKQKEDIELLLQESENWFGEDFNKPFHLFDRFNNIKDLLFKDSTLGINYRKNADSKFLTNYKNLLKNAEKCFTPKIIETIVPQAESPQDNPPNTPGSADSYLINFGLFLVSLLFTF